MTDSIDQVSSRDTVSKIGTTLKYWDRSETMYQLTLSARYRSENTGNFSNLIETHSILSNSKTLITGEAECIKKGIWDCGVRYGWGLNWKVSEILIEQWIKYSPTLYPIVTLDKKNESPARVEQ